jgi:hypothetical protein
MADDRAYKEVLRWVVRHAGAAEEEVADGPWSRVGGDVVEVRPGALAAFARRHGRPELRESGRAGGGGKEEEGEEEGGAGGGEGRGGAAGGSEATWRPMSAEDREFLEKAIEEMTYDEGKRMEHLAEQLAIAAGMKEGEALGEAEVLALFDELAERCENLDAANILDAVGGMLPLRRLLASESVALRCAAARTLTTSAQNFPPVQHLALEYGMLHIVAEGVRRLVGALGADATADAVEETTAFVAALSALVRGHAPAELAARSEGVAGLLGGAVRAVGRRGLRLVSKVGFFVRQLSLDAEWREELLRAGVLDALVDVADAEAARWLSQDAREWGAQSVVAAENTLAACTQVGKAVAEKLVRREPLGEGDGAGLALLRGEILARTMRNAQDALAACVHSDDDRGATEDLARHLEQLSQVIKLVVRLAPS